MKIVSELSINVDNDYYCGRCRLLGLDCYPDSLFEMNLQTRKALINGKEYDAFIALSTMYEDYIESQVLSVYLLTDSQEKLLGSVIEIEGVEDDIILE